MSHNSIMAIQTRYAGHRFRSRLEARWAVFLDAMGLRWSYEAEGYSIGDLGRYLPDFFVPSLHGGVYLEVKPYGYLPDKSEQAIWCAFSSQIGHPIIIVRGLPSSEIQIGIRLDRGAASWERYSFAFTPEEGAKLFIRPTDSDAVDYANQDAILAASEARFEFGETPVIAPSEDSIIQQIKGRLNEAISTHDDDLAEDLHSRLIDIEIRQWAPWRMVSG